MSQHFRAIRLIKESIDLLSLNLSGLNILTEVGSKNYLYTPIIPSLAGAEKVFAWVKDSTYGKASDIVNECKLLADSIGINNIEFLENERNFQHIQAADIITNSGAIRPINEQFLRHCKKDNISIPLMFEAWELRKEDIDIDACKNYKVKVAGTWENHPSLKVFDYAGYLAVKMAFDAGFEVKGNNIIVWSDDHFGDTITSVFEKLGATVTLTTDRNLFYSILPTTDFVFIADYDESKSYFSDSNDSVFDYREIQKISYGTTFIHLYGNVDITFCKNNDIITLPLKQGKNQVMTHTLGYIGMIPIIKLLVAGFKVGQELNQNKLTSLSQLFS